MVGTGKQVGEQITGRYKDAPVLAIAWTVDDIRHCERDMVKIHSLTDDDCLEIMRDIYMNHDANIGINWDVIESAIIEYVERTYPDSFHEWSHP